MDDLKVHFSLKISAGGGFRAQGLNVPISANATSLRDLRAKLAAATRDFFGYERQLSILVGVPLHEAAPQPVAPLEKTG